MAITRTIYTQGKVTLKTGLIGGALSNFAVVSGVQNASFSMETPRENVNSFGFKGLIDKVQVAPETATVNFSYILPKENIETDGYGATVNHLSPSKISGLMGDALSDTHSGIHVELAGLGCLVSGIMSSFSINASAGDLATIDMTFEGVPSGIGGSLGQDTDSELPAKNSNISTATYDVLTPDRISGFLPDNSLGNDVDALGDLTKVLYTSDFSANVNSFVFAAGTLTAAVTPKNPFTATSDINAGATVVNVASTVGLSVGQVLTKISGTGAFGANAVISVITNATSFTVSVNHATTGSMVFSVPFDKPGSWLEVKNAAAGLVQLSKPSLAGTNLDNYTISFRVFNNSGVQIFANASLDDASALNEFSNPPISIGIGEDKLISFSSKLFHTSDLLLIRFGPTAGTVDGPTGNLDLSVNSYIYIKDIVVSTDGGANNAGNFAGCVQSATFSWEVPIERIQCLGETVSSSTNFGNPPGTATLTLEGIDVPYPVSGLTLGDMRIMLRNAKVVSREHNLAVGDVAATFNLSLEATAMDVSMFPTLTSN